MSIKLFSVQVFGGNMDIKTERRHYLNVPMVARYVRIHPRKWRRRIGLRVGILGQVISEVTATIIVKQFPYGKSIESTGYRR
jgi:hypothetical protein